MYLDDFTLITKALSDTHRVRALIALRNGELCVCNIIDILALAPSTVSKHMTVLRQAGLVTSRKDSRWVYYRLIDGWADNPIISLVIDLLHKDAAILRDDKHIIAQMKGTVSTACCIPAAKTRTHRKGLT